MKKYSNIAIIISILSFAWFFGEYLYPYMGRYDVYLIFMVVQFALLLVLRKKIGWKYVWIGVVGLVSVALFWIVTSPHRMRRMEQWLNILFS